MRVLVIRTSALGDVVLTTPFLRALSAHLDRPVEVLTSPPYATLLDGLPFVSRVWSFERDRGIGGMVRALAEDGPFDLAIDLQNKARTLALLLRLPAKERRRLVKRKGIGGALGSLFGGGPVLHDEAAASLYFETVADRGVVPGSLLPEVAVHPDAKAAAEKVLGRAEGAPIVGLAPGARWALKKWTPERFAEVGAALQTQGAELLLVGGPQDRAEIDRILGALPRPALGDTTALGLADLAALLARLELLVSVDSGPAHLAQAVGTPVVSLFGPTSFRRWGPAEGMGGVVALPLACSPCTNYGKGSCSFGDRACLEALPAEAVIEVAGAALRAGRAEGGRAAAGAAARSLLPLAEEVARMERPWKVGRGA